MPRHKPITTLYPIPENLTLLNTKIDRKCDRDEWGINKMVDRIYAINSVVPDLIEREKQLFEYYKIPYVEIKQNELHYLIRELAAAAGFHGFEYKDFAPDGFGGWNGKFGTIFYLRVILLQMETKQKASKCIEQIKKMYEHEYTSPEYVLAKRFSEIPKTNETIKALQKFNLAEFKKLSKDQQDEYIVDVKTLINSLVN